MGSRMSENSQKQATQTECGLLVQLCPFRQRDSLIYVIECIPEDLVMNFHE